MTDHETFMRRAIELSRERMRDNDGGPFGAVVVRDGEIIGEGWNRVITANDPTAHAEVTAIREACERVGSFTLEGAEIYSSCEPCPMCLAAIYWARIGKVYYANTREDAAAIEFDDAFLYREIAIDEAHRSLPCEHLLHDEALEVFKEWRAKPDRVHY